MMEFYSLHSLCHPSCGFVRPLSAIALRSHSNSELTKSPSSCRRNLPCRAEKTSPNGIPEPDSNTAMTKSDLESCQWLQSSKEGAAAARIADPRDVDHWLASGSCSEDYSSCFGNGSVAAATQSTSRGPSTRSSVLINSLPSPQISSVQTVIGQAESAIERAIFDFRFLSLMAVAGSLAGSFLCFVKGCMFIMDSYMAFYNMCLRGVHNGKVVLHLVEAVDVYLVGTVMLIFGMGLYGLFISNIPCNLPPNEDRALQNSSLFGMFILKERPKWMRIGSLDELKTKLGHVIVMILLVKMFERSKMVPITTGADLLSYSISIFLSSAALLVLHKLHH